MYQFIALSFSFLISLPCLANLSEIREILKPTTLSKKEIRLSDDFSSLLDGYQRFHDNTQLLTNLKRKLRPYPHLKNEVLFLSKINFIFQKSNKKEFTKVCTEDPALERMYLKYFLHACATASIKNLEGLKDKDFLQKFYSKFLKKYYDYSNPYQISRYLAKLDNLNAKISSYTINSLITDGAISPHNSILKKINIGKELTAYLQKIQFYDLSILDRQEREFKRVYSETKESLYQNSLISTNESIKDISKFLGKSNIIISSNEIWNRINHLGKISYLNKKFSLARKFYSWSFQYADEENLMNSQFSYVWTYIENDQLSKAAASIDDFQWEKKLSKLPSKNLFWMAQVYEKSENKEDALRIYKHITENFPINYYGINSSKRIYEISLKEDDPLEALLESPSKVIPLKYLNKEFKSLLRRIGFHSYARNDSILRFLIAQVEAEPFQNYLSDIGKKQVLTQTEFTNNFSFISSFVLFRSQNYLESFKHIISRLEDNSLSANPALVKILFPRPYLNIIKRYKKGIDEDIVLSLIRQESAFNPEAISSAGARGLMQLMPATARSISRRISSTRLYQPRSNIKVGISYLKKLYKKYDEDLILTLSAYNAGEGNLRKWQKKYFPGKSRLKIVESIPFDETQKYVKLIHRNLFFYKYLRKQADPKLAKKDIFDVAKLNLDH